MGCTANLYGIVKDPSGWYLPVTAYLTNTIAAAFYCPPEGFNFFKSQSHSLRELETLWSIISSSYYSNMMTSSRGNIFRVTGHLLGDFTGHRWTPLKGQLCGALMFYLICSWINGWVNNGEAGDLRRHCAHYDVTVMKTSSIYVWIIDTSAICHGDMDPRNISWSCECTNTGLLCSHILSPNLI